MKSIIAYCYGNQVSPPHVTTRAFAAAAMQNGARILTHHTVTGMQQRVDDPYQAETAPATFAAGAGCAPLGKLLRLDIPLVPVRWQM